MTELNEEHFELHSANKARLHEQKKKMTNMNDFFANRNKKMLVDGDLLVYKITSSLEEPIDWGDDVWTLTSDLKKGKQLFTQAIAYYWDLTKSKDAIILFSDKEKDKIISEQVEIGLNRVTTMCNILNGRNNPTKQHIDLNESITNIHRMFKVHIGKSHLDLGVIPKIFAQKDMVEIFLSNLYKNAIEASKESAQITIKTF